MRWRVDGIPTGVPDVAVFVDTTRATLFDGPPLRTNGVQRELTVSGLAADTEYFVGLAVVDPVGVDVRSGPVLRAVTGTPLYCDASSTSPNPDGRTPATAYANLQSAVIGAFLAGGANLWIAGGVYPDLVLNLPPNVHLYGGFEPGFGGGRDPGTWPTRLTGRDGADVLSLLPADDPAIVEGVILDGAGIAANALEADGAEGELREVVMTGAGRGARLRAPDDEVLRMKFVGCVFRDNRVEGLSIEGAFDLLAEACEFSGNAVEGVDAGKLIAPDGDQAGITLRDCRVFDNGAQGVDIDLDAPSGGGGTGGRFEILLEDCAFEVNGESGFLVDIDYEQQPLWSAEIVIRGCETRANGLHGGSLDLDSRAAVLVHRLASTSNRGAGLRITSESRPGSATVSSSTFAGNLGPGAWLSGGNVGAAFAHCVVAGNAGGGLVSDFVPSTAHSTVFHLQPAALDGVTAWASVEVPDAAPAPFRNTPLRFGVVQSVLGTELRLGSGPGPVAIGQVAEVQDDRSARQVTAVSATGILVDPPVAGLATPFALALFAPQPGLVAEDYGLAVGSPALGVGMARPAAPAVDAGVLGAPWGGPPGREDLLPREAFFFAERTPSWGVALGPMQDLELGFEGGVPGSASLGAAIFAIDSVGASLAIGLELAGERVVVHPPAGGWSGGTTLQVHSELTSIDGLPLAVPVAFALEVN